MVPRWESITCGTFWYSWNDHGTLPAAFTRRTKLSQWKPSLSIKILIISFFPDHMIKFCKHLRLMKTDIVMLCKFISITGTRHANRPKLIFLHQQYRPNVWVNKRCLDRCIDFSGVPDLFQHIERCSGLTNIDVPRSLSLHCCPNRWKIQLRSSYLKCEWPIFACVRWSSRSLSFSLSCVEASCRLDAFSCIRRWLREKKTTLHLQISSPLCNQSKKLAV